MGVQFTYVDESFPELAKNFKDQSKIHVTKSCKDKVELICPCCGETYNCRVVDYIKAGHVPCLLCNDGFPYTEKFMGNVLKQLNISYIFQFNPKWAKPYRYDFCFKYKDINYIIEMDGYGHGFTNTYNRSIEECIKIDNIKDKYAFNHNYQIIRIDCNYRSLNRFEYIKNSIISKLNHILPLEKIDWELCNKTSLKSKFHEVINIYKNKTKCLEEIAELTDLKTRTVIKYITEAMENNLIPKEKLDIKKDKQKNRIPTLVPRIITKEKGDKGAIYCYEDALLFQSQTDVSLYYGFNRSSLSIAMNNNNGYYKGRHFERFEKLPQDFDFKRIVFSEDRYNNSGSKKIICQYTLNDELVHVYIRKEEIPKNMCISNIWRCCIKQRETAYGFKWKILNKKDEFEIFEMIRANKFARFYFAN